MTDKQIHELATKCLDAINIAVQPGLADEDVHELQRFAIYRVLRKNLTTPPATAERKV